MKDVDLGLTPYIVSAGQLAKNFTKEGRNAHMGAWTAFRKQVRERSSRDLQDIDHKLMNWAVSGRIPLEIFRNLALRQYYNLARSWKTVIASGLLGGDFDPLTEKLSKETARKVVAMLQPLADERKLEGTVFAAYRTLSDFATGTGDFGRHVRRNLEDELDRALAQLGVTPAASNVATAPAADEEVEEEFAMETDHVAELSAKITELSAKKTEAIVAEDYDTAGKVNAELKAAQAELSALQADETVALPDDRAQKEAKRSELTARIADLTTQKAEAIVAEDYDTAGKVNAELKAAQAELSALDNPVEAATAAAEPSGPADPSANSGGGTPTSSRTAARVQNAAGKRGAKAAANGGDGHPVTDPVERLAAHGVNETTDPQVIALVRKASGTKKVAKALDLLGSDAGKAIDELRNLAEIAG